MKAMAALMCVCCFTAVCAGKTSVKSPDGNISVTFNLDRTGKPEYSVSYKNRAVVRPSRMGFTLADGTSLAEGFKIKEVTRQECDSVWTPVWGENETIREHYNGMTVSLTKAKTRVDIEFRAFDEGVGFRYVFRESPVSPLVIQDEVTSFAMNGDHTAWWIKEDYDSQEFEYTESRLSEITAPGVQTSLMMKTDDGLYVNLHEAALVDFPAMHLRLDKTSNTFRAHLTPRPDGTAAITDVPFRTPWRTVTVSDRATDILASNLILNLNDPCQIKDTSWIHPVKFMGVWWEMITGKSGWNYTSGGDIDLATFDYASAKPTGRHGANNENVRRYIDFASRHGFDQLLVEGWNIGWEDWFGKEKDFVFDFVTPYPDFDIAALNEYAHSKGIKLMMHHETSGSIANYERHLDAAYDLMNRYGYDIVKSGYVGNILPKGEYHYSQDIVRHYLNAVKKGAEKHIMVNAHEAVRPTGLCRTWPNLMANESALGQEYAEMSPRHVTVLPFTRLQGGPMDFTPGIFRMNITEFAPGYQGKKKRATICNQLALYLTMYSPVQMAGDLPEHYERHIDAFQFIKDVPVDWSRSEYLDAEPGDYIVVARKDRNGPDWYVGGVTNEEARDYTLRFGFLPEGREYECTVYCDATDSDGFTNPETYTIYRKRVTSASELPLKMARAGGFAVRLQPVFSALQLNVWQECTKVPGGFETLVSEIEHRQPDLVTLSEVRNYNGVDFTARLCESLKQKGLRYYSRRSDDSGIISRYPINDYSTVYPLQDDCGSIYCADVDIDGIRLALYTAHLDWHHYSCYNARGYDGSTWKECERPADAQTLVDLGLKSKRTEAISRFVESAREKMGQGRHVILGGDFNEPSFRDWTPEMSSEFGHNGFTVQWPVTTMLERDGFKDMWRTVYPDPVRNPGITYPSDVPSLPADKICWAPKADDRDRIDFLFGSAGVEPVDAFVVGPRTSMCRSGRVKETDSDSIADVSDKWFSDHKGVMVKFVVSGTPRHGYSLR